MHNHWLPNPEIDNVNCNWNKSKKSMLIKFKDIELITLNLIYRTNIVTIWQDKSNYLATYCYKNNLVLSGQITKEYRYALDLFKLFYMSFK